MSKAKVTVTKNILPNIGDVIVVIPILIDEACIRVSLLEYGEIEGIISTSQVSSKRIRSLKSVVDVGSVTVARVMKVDVEKKYVDLSRLRIDAEEEKNARDKWTKSKSVLSLIRSVAKQINPSDELFDDLYRRTVWEIEDIGKSAYDVFVNHIGLVEALDTLQISGEEMRIFKAMSDNVVERVAKIRAKIEMTCNTPEGVDAIIDACKIALCDLDNARIPVRIQVLGPPLYSVTTTTTDIDSGVSAVKLVCEKVITELTKRGGECVIKEAARVLSDESEKASEISEHQETQPKEITFDAVHLRLQVRNARKSMTIVEGLPPKIDLKEMVANLRKLLSVNGCILTDEKTGGVALKFQGDQRKTIKSFLITSGFVDESDIKIHGF